VKREAVIVEWLEFPRGFKLYGGAYISPVR